MLMRGSARRTAQEIARMLDGVGATLSFSTGIETTVFGGRALSGDLPLLLELAAEATIEPSFPDDEAQRVRGELITAIRVNTLDTRQVAERVFRRLAFPDGHPYHDSPDGDEAALTALTVEDLRGFHREYVAPEAMIIAMVGDVEPRRATDHVAEAFGRWASAGPVPARPLPGVTPPPTLQREETALPGKTQSDLILGVPGVARGDPEYYDVMMANLLLGQLGMMGRIGQNVRERQGMAYYAFSDLRAGLLAGPWWVRAGVNPANVDRAVDAILHEVRTLQQQGPEDGELADARTFLTGSLAVRLEATPGLANTLADIELFDLGLDYLERYPAIVNAVGRDAVVAASQRFSVDRYTLAIAGPRRHQ
jgi:zinc protease